MRPDALVFDLDGTLWDTTGTCADAWNRVLTRLGLVRAPVTADDVRRVSGQPHREAIRRAFPDLPEATIDVLAAETADEDNRAVAAHGGTLYPGVRETIPLLRARVPLLIVSNCQRGYVETFLAWSGLGSSFVDHECWGNTGASKGANLAAVVQRNALRAPLFVGDTDGDRAAADENRIPFVPVTWGYGDVARHDHRVERIDDLTSLVA
jgi:phosphoglycolate phosphatase